MRLFLSINTWQNKFPLIYTNQYSIFPINEFVNTYFYPITDYRLPITDYRLPIIYSNPCRNCDNFVPCSLLPVPCSLFPIPCSLFPMP
ncbi:hypothetical protein [Moorena producens]|uniref:hypothetical protein n=1 Tax=Moorena producens TaxID=1155739 RepID=UPI001313FDF9|nr:hypothetical protein [Moorena producens]